jgi:glutathione S-transferase
MIKLHGVGLSNYYNMLKLALMEKGMAFEEVKAVPTQEDAFKSKSPMGKVPCIETADGFLSETNVTIEYFESVQPEPALLPSEPFARGKVLELMKVMELYVELPSRRHYGEIFFGGERNQAAFDEARPVLENGLKALKQLGAFTPYVTGSDFSAADVVAAYTFCYAAPIAKAIYDWDIMSEVPGLQGAIDATNARDAGAKVAAAHGAAVKALQDRAS